eukprot:3087161-Rhodomonas_salina.1
MDRSECGWSKGWMEQSLDGAKTGAKKGGMAQILAGCGTARGHEGMITSRNQPGGSCKSTGVG